MNQNQQQVVVKLAHKFGKCKAGALHRFQKAAAEVAKAWAADVETIQKRIDEEGLQRSNMALYKTKAARTLSVAEAEAKQVLELIQEDYRVELHRLVTQFGGDVENHVATFPDGSTASVPKKLFLEDQKLAALLK